MRLHLLLIPGLIVGALAEPSCCAITDEFAAGQAAQPTGLDDAARADAIDSLLRVAREADAAERDADAAEAYFKILELDPKHKEAFECVSRIMDNAVLPDDEKRIAEVLATVEPFGGKWKVHRSPHFVVIYNTDERFARLRGALLELAHKVYFEQFRKAEQRPLPLREKLVCILFDKRKPFIEFARKVDNNQAAWTSGYYSARNNWTVFYDDDDNPIFHERKQQIAQLKKQEDELTAKINTREVRRNAALSGQLKRERAQLIEQRRKIENRIEQVRRITNASKTVHEATHQLSFNTGVMGRRQHYPFWIAEGMATNFEPDGPGQPFGPFIDNPSRRRTLRAANDKRKLMPLKEFVVLMRPDPKAEDDEVRVNYAQAWGLFKFLFTRRHAQMRDYLIKLRDIPPGPREPDVMLQEFDDAFGPIRQLQEEFDRWLKRQ